MVMGSLLIKRMSDMGVSAELLAQETLMEIDDIRDIMEDRIDFEQIDEFDRGLISVVLLCNPDYFLDENVRNRDIVNASLNRGNSDFRTNMIKAIVQQCTDDLLFLQSISSKLRR
jgi:hypothetical protein